MSEKKEMTLKEMIHKMIKYNNNGYSCYVSGNGDGSVTVIAEEDVVTIQ